MWLQDSKLTTKVGSTTAAYLADLTKAFCEGLQQCNHSEVM